jgi:glycosyltransferase involved in cell wall biosynthesis
MGADETIRVLHVVPGLAPQQGGVAVNVLGIARAARASGVSNRVYALDTREPASAGRQTRVTFAELEPFLNGVEVELFRVRRPYRFMYSPELRHGLERSISGFDLVQLHSLFLYPQYAAFRQAHRISKPYIVTVHGCLDPALRHRNKWAKRLTDRLWQRQMLDEAALLHFTTEAERDLVADLEFRAPSVVVPNGIDWQAFQPDAQTRRAQDDGVVTILYLGRLSHKKGLDLLLEAFALVRRDLNGAKLVVAGPDDENLSAQLASQARRLGVHEDVTFPGHLGADERLRVLASADVSVLPSQTENFGTTVIESMAAGVPVIISPQVNLAASIAQARAGIVCDRNPVALADALMSVLCDHRERERLRVVGRDFALTYDWSLIGPQLRGMYELALDTR